MTRNKLWSHSPIHKHYVKRIDESRMYFCGLMQIVFMAMLPFLITQKDIYKNKKTAGAGHLSGKLKNTA